MVLRNDDYTNLACIKEKIVDEKKLDCDCCGRVVRKNHRCHKNGARKIGNNAKKNRCENAQNSKTSSNLSSSTSYDRSGEQKYDRYCKRATKIECMRISKHDDSISNEIYRTDFDLKSCENLQNTRSNESSSKFTICDRYNHYGKNILSKEIDSKEVHDCEKKKRSSCDKISCLVLDDSPEICTQVPSIIRHVERCKENFLKIIEASLSDIGKTKDPEQVIQSTLRAARDKRFDRLAETEEIGNDHCERSFKDRDEFDFLKNLTRNDFVSTICEESDNRNCDKSKPEVCRPCCENIKEVVPCTKNEFKTSKNYKDEEISEFVKIIDLKLREELTKNLRKNLCTEDKVVLKNSYYCIATLCPCMTKNYSLKGPLVLGPFNFGPQDERIDVCRNELSERVSSSSSDTVNSFHYSDCIAGSDTDDCDDSTNTSNTSSCNVICPKYIERNDEKKKSSNKIVECTNREPIILEHHSSYVDIVDKRAEEHLDKSYSKKSELVAKWGKCYDLVDTVFYERDERIRMCDEMGLNVKVADKNLKKVSCKHKKTKEDEEYSIACGLNDKVCISKLFNSKRQESYDYYEPCENICGKPSHTCRVGFDGACITGDDFDNLDRFRDIGSHGFAKLCRKLFKWVHCISKNWQELRSYPHIVVHLPSLNYNNKLKCRARKTFDYLQNIQVGRVGWLDDPNVEVLYVFPTPQDDELLNILKDLIITVRPDIDVSKRLSMLRPEPKCIMKKCVSGSSNLFYSPEVYRRVRFLTAGRHAFILPGVIDQNNIFIACELKIPNLGPPLQFQKRLVSKSYVMELLDVNKIHHPPFLHVHSFGQLCRGMAVMVMQYSIYKTWFVKIDNGFYGYQTAIVKFKKGILGSVIRNIKRTCTIDEDYLCKLLAEVLPIEIQVQKSIYPNKKDFFHDLETFGGIIQACPNDYYDVLSLGVFIEHDLAKPVVITAAEIIHYGSDVRNDMAYFLPQNKILSKDLDLLVERIGKILLNEHVVGYFGIDLVTFRDRFDVQQSWVIDIDPYYTDLIAFSDWVKFCIGPCKDNNKKYVQENINLSYIVNINELLIKANRHAICCGKLFGIGLSKYCGRTLINLCKQNQIYYDNQEKIGCMVYPTDSRNRALNIVSINSTRLLTMQKFIDALKVLNELSLRNNGQKTLADTVDLSNRFEKIV